MYVLCIMYVGVRVYVFIYGSLISCMYVYIMCKAMCKCMHVTCT
jgi:hypothetical protein